MQWVSDKKAVAFMFSSNKKIKLLEKLDYSKSVKT